MDVNRLVYVLIHCIKSNICKPRKQHLTSVYYISQQVHGSCKHVTGPIFLKRVNPTQLVCNEVEYENGHLLQTQWYFK